MVANISGYDVCTALNRCTVQPFTEGDDTRCYVNTIFPPEDRHVNVRNMFEDNSVTNIFLMNKENFALKLVDEITQHYEMSGKLSY